jgi:hypothetical protein
MHGKSRFGQTADLSVALDRNKMKWLLIERAELRSGMTIALHDRTTARVGQ